MDSYPSNGLPSKCNLCQRSENPCVDVQNDHRRVLTVADLTRVPSWNIRKILSCICSRCLLFIGSLTETSNLLRLNCANALKCQNSAQLTPSTTESTSSNSVLPLTLTPSPDIVANNVDVLPQAAATTIAATKLCQTKDVGTQIVECGLGIPSTETQDLSLLEIHHERNVSPLATESGGVHYETSNNWPSWIPKAAQRECSYCNRLFRRKTDYAKHYRRCQAAKMRYSRSMVNPNRMSMYQDDLESTASEGAKENRLLKIHPRSPIFRCPQCPATFKSMLHFKEHTLLHRKKFICDICGYNSTTQHQFNFHRAECISKLEVRRENESIAGKQQLPARRRTRAHSLFISVALENISRCSTTDQITKKECLDAAEMNKAKTMANSNRNQNCEKTKSSVNGQSKNPVTGNSPLATEKSTGKHACFHCNLSFRRKDYYRKHRLRCINAKKHCAKSQKLLPSEKVNESPLLEIQTRTPRFSCSQCPSTFKSLLDLKEHTFLHRKQFNCDICGYNSTTQYLSDFHRAECISKLEVKRENESTAGKQQMPARRKTRAYSIFISAGEENKSRGLTKDMTNDRIAGTECLDEANTNGSNNVRNSERNTNCEKSETSVHTTSKSQEIGRPPLASEKTAGKYVCLSCNHSFRRQDYYRKHHLRCSNDKKRCAKSLKLLEIPPRTKRFSCSQCPATFKSMLDLKEHTFSHRKQFNCDICGYNSITQYLFDFHRVECISKLEVRRENETTSGKQQMPARRKTRAYSLFISVGEENKSRGLTKKVTNDRIVGTECLDEAKTNGSKTVRNSGRNPKADTFINSTSKSQEIGRFPLASEKTAGKYVCLSCNHSFRRKDYYRKHHLRCLNGKKGCDTLESLPFEKINESPLLETGPTPAQHICVECSVSFESMFQLRGHMRIHSKRFKCVGCDHESITQQQFYLHHAKCVGTGNGTTTGKQQLPARRITRSCTQDFLDIELISTAEKEFDDIPTEAADKNTKLEITPSIKRKYCDEIFLKTVKSKKVKSCNLTNSHCQDDPPPAKSVHSTMSDYIRANDISTTVSEDPYMGCHREYDNNDDDEDEEYQEDDDVSVVDSLYSRRLSYTNHWLNTHNNLTSHTSFNEDIAYVFKDLSLLERLRHEIKLKEITCYEPNCGVASTSLNVMMFHDYNRHYKYSWFFCPKCGKCFTSKIFLDYHLDIQDRGQNYLCHKCGIYFLRRYELHCHLLQHVKQSAVEVEKLTCYSCSFVFLDQQSLSKHCAATGHDCRHKRQFIRIDHSKTITNTVPLENSTALRNISYSVKTIEMHTVPLPRQPSISKERYNARLRVGMVEFKEPWKANCVGMFGGH